MVNKGMKFTSATVGCKISSILSTTKELTTNRSSPLAEFCEAIRFVVKQWILFMDEQNTLLYVGDTAHLPGYRQVMEFPRYTEGLLKNLLEQFQQTQKVNATPKLHLLLHELLDTIFERKNIDISFVTHD